jgi:hypothetical protein
MREGYFFSKKHKIGTIPKKNGRIPKNASLKNQLESA